MKPRELSNFKECMKILLDNGFCLAHAERKLKFLLDNGMIETTATAEGKMIADEVALAKVPKRKYDKKGSIKKDLLKKEGTTYKVELTITSQDRAFFDERAKFLSMESALCIRNFFMKHLEEQRSAYEEALRIALEGVREEAMRKVVDK